MELIDKNKLIEKIGSTPSGCFYTGPEKVMEMISEEPEFCIETINPDKDDTIIIYADTDKFDYKYILKIHEEISSAFKNNKVLTVPFGISIATTKEPITDISENV